MIEPFFNCHRQQARVGHDVAADVSRLGVADCSDGPRGVKPCAAQVAAAAGHDAAANIDGIDLLAGNDRPGDGAADGSDSARHVDVSDFRG